MNKLISIVLGASKFPKTQLKDSVNFLNSAQAVKDQLMSKDTGLTLDLFDSDLDVASMLVCIDEFISSHLDSGKEVENLLIYYVGHGDLTPEDDYYLAINQTNDKARASSSIRVIELANILNNLAGNIRKFIILDCCYAGTATLNFQSDNFKNLSKAIAETLPIQGTSLMCASSKWKQAKYNSNEPFTMFSDGLIHVLEHGIIEIKRESLSFREIVKEVYQFILAKYKEDAVRPEIHSPGQAHGDISELSLFSNKAYSSIKPTSLHELIVQKYFRYSQYRIKEYNQTVASDFSDLFTHFLARDTKLELEGSKLDSAKNNLIHFLSDEIIKSNSVFPILVDGYTGTGKSLLLGLLYLDLYHRSLSDNSFCPVYINLHYYEYFIYKTSDVRKSAEDKLSSDLEEILNCEEVKGKSLIVIIDGADEYIRPKVKLYDEVKLQVKRFNKKIIGIRKFKSHGEPRFVNISGNPGIKISLSSISTENNSKYITEVINVYSRIVALYASNGGNNIQSDIIRFVESFNLNEIDLFSLRLLTEASINPLQFRVKDDEINSLSSILEIYCRTRLDSQKLLDKAAQLSFETFNLDVGYSPEKIDDPGWELISSHHTVRNFLIARYVVHLFKNPNTDRTELYDFVYPHEVNSFIKQIINQNAKSQQKVLKGIEVIWESVSNEHMNTKTHLTYLLGRFDDVTVKERAYSYLERIKNSEEVKDIIDYFNSFEQNPSDTSSIQMPDRANLLFLRSIYISLIYLGQGTKSKESSREYIEFCLKNPFLENLNRGFHLEYYGDIPFDPDEAKNLRHQDELGSCNLTFNKLMHKLEAAVNKYRSGNHSVSYYPMFEVELFTVCSLVQHRALRNGNNLGTGFISRLSSLLNTVFDQKVVNEDSRLWDYLLLVQTFVCSEIPINVGEMFNLINSLKRRHRRGWEKKGEMDKMRVERVSSHVWGTEDVAYYFLPEKTDEQGYNKYSIIKMLHFHDTAEAFTSDLVRGEKKEEDRREEKRWMSILSAVGMINEFSELLDVKSLFLEFESKNSVNARYANDCDRLECFLQAKNYFIRNEISSEVYEDFSKNLKRELKTDWGQNVYKVFNSIREDFLLVEKHFLKNRDSDLT